MQTRDREEGGDETRGSQMQDGDGDGGAGGAGGRGRRRSSRERGALGLIYLKDSLYIYLTP